MEMQEVVTFLLAQLIMLAQEEEELEEQVKM